MANARYRILKKGTNIPIFSANDFRGVEDYWNRLAKYQNPDNAFFVVELKNGVYTEVDPPKYSKTKNGW